MASSLIAKHHEKLRHEQPGEQSDANYADEKNYQRNIQAHNPTSATMNYTGVPALRVNARQLCPSPSKDHALGGWEAAGDEGAFLVVRNGNGDPRA